MWRGFLTSGAFKGEWRSSHPEEKHNQIPKRKEGLKMFDSFGDSHRK
jgi:hypothetical protein